MGTRPCTAGEPARRMWPKRPRRPPTRRGRRRSPESRGTLRQSGRSAGALLGRSTGARPRGGGGLEVTHNGEPPALDVDRPAVELPWWRQTAPSEALLHTAAHRARELQALTADWGRVDIETFPEDQAPRPHRLRIIRCTARGPRPRGPC